MDCSRIKIETSRLLLISARSEYAELVFKEYRSPVTLYMNYPAPENVETVVAGMKEREVQMSQGRLLYLNVFLKQDMEFLGSFALENLLEPHLEMGGWLKSNAHGKGYGKEIVKALKDWADIHVHYTSIIWPCVIENVASCKLAESLDGTIERRYRKKNKTGYAWDYLEYHIKR